MRLDTKTHELKLIAKAFPKISKEISYQGLALERARVALCADFGKSLPNIKAAGVQLQQLVFNFVRERRSGILTACSKPANDHIFVTVADTGGGIDVANKSRLFDALHTTKANNLGPGLSICREIATVHGGHLWVKEMHDTTHAFLLPLRSSIQMPGNP
jgi:C4-dicarboxylate-specific signal transduction histidine kinase